jgi:hypothetical protein
MEKLMWWFAWLIGGLAYLIVGLLFTRFWVWSRNRCDVLFSSLWNIKTIWRAATSTVLWPMFLLWFIVVALCWSALYGLMALVLVVQQSLVWAMGNPKEKYPR